MPKPKATKQYFLSPVLKPVLLRLQLISLQVRTGLVLILKSEDNYLDFTRLNSYIWPSLISSHVCSHCKWCEGKVEEFLTLKVFDKISYCVTHRLLSTYQISTQSEKHFCGLMDIETSFEADSVERWI